MCPLWPLHYIILYLLLFYSLFYVILVAASNVSISDKSKLWDVTFMPLQIIGLKMSQVKKVNFTTSDLNKYDPGYSIVRIVSSDDNIVDCTTCQLHVPDLHDINLPWHSSFNLQGKFLGSAEVKLRIESTTGFNQDVVIRESLPVKVSVIRHERLVDKIFTISVAALVSIIFINFGCALNWPTLKETLKRPIGPVIGFIAQFLFMPIISFMLGKCLFPNSVPMQLGLFFTGICPGGGASNVWIYMLGGNINLSITMTALSTLASFVMMPLWIFTLGRQIFSSGSMTVPYSRIASFAVALIIPLAIGYFLQRKFPKVSQLMVRILKPFSGCLIVFIIVFASLTNLYLFQLFTWRIMIAGLGLPWLGYIFGWLFAKCFNQNAKDTLAIAVETGIQNTGIAIFMLRFSLGQPEADLTTVVPVAVALMTPVPLMFWYFFRKLSSSKEQEDMEKENSEKILVSPIDDKLCKNIVKDEQFSHFKVNIHT